MKVPPWQTTRDLALMHIKNYECYSVLQADIIKLCAHIDFLSMQNKKLSFMVDNGLGHEDLIDNRKYPTGE